MRPLATLLVVLALVMAADLALAAPFAAPVPPSDGAAIGAVVVTKLPPLPAGAYEFELFLVPESGAPIRVSAELPAGARAVRWRMPAVAAHSARLVLRAGGEGVEWESAPSAPFALAALPASELSRVLRGRSEAGARIESSAGAAAEGLFASPGAPVFSDSQAPDSDADSTAAPLPGPGEWAARNQEARTSDSRPATALRARSNSPARTPLRN